MAALKIPGPESSKLDVIWVVSGRWASSIAFDDHVASRISSLAPLPNLSRAV
jgi:hypothetical protein